ncbi:MAG: hypothetical protein AAB691_03490 [Patescibacteria group bacterium]
MPKQVLPDIVGFGWLTEYLKRHGFHQLSASEAYQRVAPYLPNSPKYWPHRNRFEQRHREGREAGFIFSQNGYDAVVWTTWLVREGRPRESDTGWVVISEGRKALYFAKPANRTKHFLRTLAMRAAVAKQRVAKRPHCELCNTLMRIVRGPELRERYWRCDLKHRHTTRKYTSRPWDVGLTPEMREFVEKTRREEQRYEKRLLAQGKRPHTAMLKRKRWEDRVAAKKKRALQPR